MMNILKDHARGDLGRRAFLKSLLASTVPLAAGVAFAPPANSGGGRVTSRTPNIILNRRRQHSLARARRTSGAVAVAAGPTCDAFYSSQVGTTWKEHALDDGCDAIIQGGNTRPRQRRNRMPTR
ncbi:hypothetical protein [Niveispirillum fermenti]|uniref:hypothetical protein n=1 Tax=Niveispirillum fermenti TaxID=1233113 RepID=UPI003A842400